MRLRLRFALLASAFAVFAAPTVAHAQFAIYVMGSGAILGSTPNIPGTTSRQDAGFSAGGFTIGAYDDFAKIGPLRFGIDGRYFTQHSSNSNSYGNKIHGGLVGARLSLKLPVIPLKPYIQAEAGGVGTNYGVNPDTTSSSAWQVSGGVDYTFLPHLDLRAEYGGGLITAYQAGNQVLQEFSGGVAIRF